MAGRKQPLSTALCTVEPGTKIQFGNLDRKKIKRKTFRVNRTSLLGNILSQEVLVLNVSILNFITFLLVL